MKAWHLNKILLSVLDYDPTIESDSLLDQVLDVIRRLFT